MSEVWRPRLPSAIRHDPSSTTHPRAQEHFALHCTTRYPVRRILEFFRHVGVESIWDAEPTRSRRLDAVRFSRRRGGRDILPYSGSSITFSYSLFHRCKIFFASKGGKVECCTPSCSARADVQDLGSTSRQRSSTTILSSDSLMAFFSHIPCFANP